MAWTPAQNTTSGNVAAAHWWRADSNVLNGSDAAASDGETVKTWTSKTASAKTLANATDGSRPTLETNELDGEPVIRFGRGAGATNWLSVATAADFGFLHKSTGATVFIVWKTRLATPNATYTLFDTCNLSTNPNLVGANLYWSNATGVSVSQLSAFVAKGATGTYALGPLKSAEYSLLGSQWHLSVFTSAAASGGVYNDGALADQPGGGASGHSAADPSYALTIGARANAKDLPHDGDIAELIMFTPNLSLADIREVSEYLAARYPSVTFADAAVESQATLLDDAKNNSFTSYAISSNGTRVAHWTSGTDHYTTLDKDVLQKRSTNGGGTWDASPTTLLAADATYCYGTYLGTDRARNLIASVRRDHVNGSAVNAGFMRSTDHGVTWSTPVYFTIPNPPAWTKSYLACPPLQLTDDSLVVAVYGMDSGDANYSVDLYRSTDNGVNWSRVGRIADGGDDGRSYTETGLVQIGTTLIAIIRLATSGIWRATAALSDLSTWSAKTSVATYLGGSPVPILIRDDHIVWLARHTGGDWRARLVVSRDAGVTWQVGNDTPSSGGNYMTYGRPDYWGGRLSCAYSHQAADTNADVFYVGDGAYSGFDSVALTVEDSTVVSTSDTVALTQHYALAVEDAQIASTSESPALTQHHVLTVSDSDIVVESESVALSVVGTLSVSDAIIAVESDTPILTQHYVVAVSDSELVVMSDTVTLSVSSTLAISDSDIAVASDSPALIQHHVLTVADAECVVTSDGVTLAMPGVLVVADAVCVVTSGTVTLSIPGSAVPTSSTTYARKTHIVLAALNHRR